MSFTAIYATPSTLADVIGQVIDLFAAVGDATPIQVGKHYLEHFGVGSPPSVVFVPEARGKIGPPVSGMGYAASYTHGCRVLVSGGEAGGDVERFRNAYALADRVLSALRRAGAGRIEFGDVEDASPTTADAFGAEVEFGFTYVRDVPHDAAIVSVPMATAASAAASPLGMTKGTPASVDAVDAATEPQE